MKSRVLMVPGSYAVQPFNQLTGEAIERLERAAKLWFGGGYSHLLLSGGIVEKWSVQTKPEAVLMQEWFQGRLAAGGHMIIDSQARNPEESAANAAASLESRCMGANVPIRIVGCLSCAIRCRNIFLARGFGRASCEFVFCGEEGAHRCDAAYA